MDMKPRLERWIQHNECLVGYVFDSKHFKSGQRIMTEVLLFVDPINFEAECKDGKYKLGEPGTAEEHNQEQIGLKPKTEGSLILDPSRFLRPNG